MEGLILHRTKGDSRKADFKFEDLNDFQTACLYECDASSNGEFLELAFEATNSIDYHWSENEGVKTEQGNSRRSTSVGDIVWIEHKIYRVEGMGFKLVLDTRF
jgi:hypothetical protein